MKRWEASVKHWENWDPGAAFGILCGEQGISEGNLPWLVVYLPPLKNDGVKVSWDGDIPFPFLNGKS